MVSKKKVACILLCVLVVASVFAQETGTKERSGFNLSASYSPFLLIEPDYLRTSFTPLSFGVRASYIPLKTRFGNMGGELSILWLERTIKEATSKLKTNILPIATNFVYEYAFSDRLQLSSHIGVGIGISTLQYIYENSEKSKKLMELGFLLDVGVALKVALVKDLYAKVGIEYIRVLPKNVVIQMIVPSLSVSYEF